MPPDSSCGYALNTRFGSRCTRSSSSRVRSWILCLSPIPWARPVSRNCSQIVMTGLNAESAAWNTIAQSAHRKRRSLSASSERTSKARLPSSYRISPFVTRALRGERRIKATARVVLPEPDSPMIAIVSPCWRSKVTSRTACTGPRRVRYSIDRSRTERTGTSVSKTRVEDVLEARGEPYERKLEERDRHDRTHQIEEAVFEEECTLVVREVEHDRPVLPGERNQTEEHDRGLRIDSERHGDDEVDDDV